jgi:hypothetical protein
MNSKLLEEAIIDAEALREAALKNAEQSILEKYAPEVRLAIETLLEQEPPMPEEDPMMDPMGMQPSTDQKEMDVPYGATDGFKLCPCPDDEDQIVISLGDLQKTISDLARSNAAPEEDSMDMPMEPEMSMDQEMPPEEPMDQLPPEEEEEEELPEEPMMEEVELDENLLLSLLSEEDDKEEDDKAEDEEAEDEEAEDEEVEDKEKADLDNDGKLSGYEEKRAKAIEKAMDKQNESKSLNKAKMLVEKKNKLLTEAVNEIKQEYSKFLKEHKKLLEEKEKTNSVVQQLSERLEETNLMNAKLFYKNQALGSDSLNERQKNKIVEAVSKAGSVDEAKMIYETLCNAVGTFDNKGPQSLSEAVEKKGGLSFKPRQQTNSNPNPIKNRWQKIAGIKK